MGFFLYLGKIMFHRIQAGKAIHGSTTVPGDKSVSHRALMIGSLADGVSEVEGLSEAADPRDTLECMHALGIKYKVKDGRVLVHGLGLAGMHKPERDLDAGNSGTTMRLLTGILSGQKFESILTGDRSLTRRPMKRILDPLSSMGAQITCTPAFTAPLHIRGTHPLKPIEYKLPIASAQVKSAILFAGLFANGTTCVIERIPTRDHTERMLGLRKVVNNGESIVEVVGGSRLEPRYFYVPGDISSAAFLIAAALLVPHSDLFLLNVSLNPTRTAFLTFLRSMGAKIHLEDERTIAGEPVGDLHIVHSRLKNRKTVQGPMVAELIDEIPILAVTGACSEGEFRLKDAADLRSKESDRIKSLVTNLRKMGVEVEEYEDGFACNGKNDLLGADLESFGDHRIAMAFAVAGLVAKGETIIRDSECVEISFPGFWQTIALLNR